MTNPQNSTTGLSLGRLSANKSGAALCLEAPVIPTCRDEISAEIVRDLVIYDPDTGRLFWRERGRMWFTTDMACAAWNKRCAGKAAFATLGQDGYLRGKLFPVVFLAHRIAFACVKGCWPEEIDHVDGDRQNNRWENLRSVSRRENTQNTKRPVNNTSGFVGVRFDLRRQKWVAKIGVDGKSLHLGYFENKFSAVSARKDAEKVHGFHPGHGRNFNA